MTSAPITTTAAPSTERTYRLEGGPSGSTFGGVALAVAAEGGAFHLFLMSKAPWLAWTLTTMNVAVLISFWRAYRALGTSALRITDSHVSLNLGSTLRVEFPRSSISSVELATWRSVPDVAPHYCNAAKPLEPNVKIVLDQPASAKMAFGIRRRVDRVDLRVADPNAVIAELSTASGQTQR